MPVCASEYFHVILVCNNSRAFVIILLLQKSRKTKIKITLITRLSFTEKIKCRWCGNNCSADRVREAQMKLREIAKSQEARCLKAYLKLWRCRPFRPLGKLPRAGCQITMLQVRRHEASTHICVCVCVVMRSLFISLTGYNILLASRYASNNNNDVIATTTIIIAVFGLLLLWTYYKNLQCLPLAQLNVRYFENYFRFTK